MERTCYRCGAPVEEQISFCAACGAPQIKVATQPEDSPAPPASAPGTSLRSETPLAHAAANTTAPWVNHGNHIQWKKFFRIAVPFAVANGLVTPFLGPVGWFITLPGSVLWCILRYRRHFPGPLSAGRGARMGCAIGFGSFGAFAGFFAVFICLTGQLRPFLVRAAQEAAARNYPAEFQGMLQSSSQSPAGMATFVLLFFATFLLLFLTFASLAGALTAALSGDKARG